MQRTHFGQHEADCFGCKAQSIQFNPYSMPSRLHPEHAPRTPNPAWERGVATDSRGMPQLRKDGSPMGVKEYAESRHKIEEHRKRAHQDRAFGQDKG